VKHGLPFSMEIELAANWSGVTGSSGTAMSDSRRGAPFGRNRTTAEANGPTPIEQRREVVDRYKVEFRQTVEQVCKNARVNRSDFYKWVKGQLPDASSKSARIEQVLRAVLVVRSDACAHVGDHRPR